MNPSPQEAQDMLDTADRLARRAARFPASWIGYVMICAMSSMHLVAAYSAGPEFQLQVLAVTLPWAFAGMVMTIVLGFTLRPVPKGFGTRWSVMIALWTFGWVFSMPVQFELSTVMFLILGLYFLALAVAGPLWELAAWRRRG